MKANRIYEHCGDCGGELGEQKVTKRASICDGCWDNRRWLLDHNKGISIKEFGKIQSCMASHRGTAKRRIEKLKEIL